MSCISDAFPSTSLMQTTALVPPKGFVRLRSPGLADPGLLLLSIPAITGVGFGRRPSHFIPAAFRNSPMTTAMKSRPHARVPDDDLVTNPRLVFGARASWHRVSCEGISMLKTNRIVIATAVVGAVALSLVPPAHAGNGSAVGAGLAGFGIGAIVGSALAPQAVYVAPPPPPVYYAPPPGRRQPY